MKAKWTEPRVRSTGSAWRGREPSREERIILLGVEAANIATGQAVAIERVVKALTAEERLALAALPGRELSTIVAKRLERLVRQGLVAASARVGKHRFYRVTSIKEVDAPVPATVPRRRRVLALVERVLAKTGRAVRVLDVLEFARGDEDCSDLTDTQIGADMQNLSTTGELVIVGTVRGGSASGGNLYLPATLSADRERYLPREPLTWLEHVARIFDSIWEEHSWNAVAIGRKPRPITNAEIRRRLTDEVAVGTAPGSESTSPGVSQTDIRWGRDLGKPMVTISALLQLAAGKGPHIRKIPGRAALWAPAWSDDAALDLGAAFATDSDRTVEAVRRALRRHRTPAVSVDEVQHEIELAPELAPAGRQRIASVLADLSRTKIAAGSGARAARAEQVIHKVGVVAGAAYYTASDHRGGAVPLAAASQYVELRDAIAAWSAAAVEARVDALTWSVSPIIATGRARLLRVECEALAARLIALRSVPREWTAAELDAVLDQLGRAASEMDRWLRTQARSGSGVPDDVDASVPGWTASEVHKELRVHSPALARMASPRAVTSLLARAIRRVPNPEFTSRRSGDTRTATELLFDRADVLRLAALRWGGVRCQLAANTMTTQVGEFRDARYLIAALKQPDIEERLAAASALAFVRSPDGLTALRNSATTDCQAGVREVALWSYGFAGGADVDELLQQAGEDPDPRMRTSARKWCGLGDGRWWRA